jgi:glycopeptide antibiotics resistance protein
LVFYYLFFLSIVLEDFTYFDTHVRSFEWSDLIGNILGVFIIFITYEIFKKKNKLKIIAF